MAYTKQNFEDGQVLTAEHLNNMERGIEDASVQSDWNQTDAAAADFIKNKPFGDVAVTLIEEQTCTPVPDDTTPVISVKAPGIGSTAQVVFNGTSFDCIVYAVEGLPAVGNMSLLSGENDTGEPFLLAWLDDQTTMCFVADYASDFVIKADGFAVLKLNPKYMDTCTYFYAHGVADGYLYTDLMCTTMATASDVYTALLFGPVVVNVYGALFFTPIMASMTEGSVRLLVSTSEADFVLYTAEYVPNS